MTDNTNTNRFRGWAAIVAIVIVTMGAVCYVLSCISAMVIANKNNR